MEINDIRILMKLSPWQLELLKNTRKHYCEGLWAPVWFYTTKTKYWINDGPTLWLFTQRGLEFDLWAARGEEHVGVYYVGDGNLLYILFSFISNSFSLLIILIKKNNKLNHKKIMLLKTDLKTKRAQLL